MGWPRVVEFVSCALPGIGSFEMFQRRHVLKEIQCWPLHGEMFAQVVGPEHSDVCNPSHVNDV